MEVDGSLEFTCREKFGQTMKVLVFFSLLLEMSHFFQCRTCDVTFDDKKSHVLQNKEACEIHVVCKDCRWKYSEVKGFKGEWNRTRTRSRVDQ